MAYAVEEEKATVGGGSLDEGNIGGTNKTLISTGKWLASDMSLRAPVRLASRGVLWVGRGSYDSRLANREERGVAGYTCNPNNSRGQGWKIAS